MHLLAIKDEPKRNVHGYARYERYEAACDEIVAFASKGNGAVIAGAKAGLASRGLTETATLLQIQASYVKITKAWFPGRFCAQRPFAEVQGMQGVVKPKWGGFARGLAFALALASLLFLLQVTLHGHANSQDEAACRLCQAAHIGVIPALEAVTLSVPLMEFGVVSVQAGDPARESAAKSFSSRAPPSLAL